VKILFVQNTDWLKRNPAQQHHLAEMLSLRGHCIHVIDYEINWKHEPHRSWISKRQVFTNISKIYREANITVIRPGIIKTPFVDYVSFMLGKHAEIRTQIRDFKPDIIVGMGISSLLAAIAAKQNDIPLINYWIDVSHRLLPNKILRPAGWLIEHQTVKLADKVLAINDKLCEYTVKIGANPDHTSVVRAGINIARFNPDIPDNLRNQLGFKETDLVLFFMGWLYNFSGLKEVALQLSKIDNQSLRLLIVGEGDAYNSLQNIIKEYNLQGRVILAGQKPYEDMPRYIAASDICLLPSYISESIMQDIVPIKLYEYMAMKKPVISTRLPGVFKEFGVDNGMVYVEKPEEVVDKAIELRSARTLNELGMKARTFVENNTWDKIAGIFETILIKTIEEKKNGKIYKSI
jgi:glycosyltransferase involved in cell wall biosynthesis